jgi:hypothetical protein
MVSSTSFSSEIVPQAPEDPLFGLMRVYKADNFKDKVDLVSFCPATLRDPQEHARLF